MNKTIIGSILIAIIFGVGGFLIGEGDIVNQPASIFHILPARICSSRSVPSINVIAPSNGQVYYPGQRITVRWTNCNVPVNDRVAVSLIYSNDVGSQWTAHWQLSPSPIVSNTGSYIVTLPTTSSFYSGALLYGQHYEIEVGLFSSQNWSGFTPPLEVTNGNSAGWFSINELN